jgi:hypothetical protein
MGFGGSLGPDFREEPGDLLNGGVGACFHAPIVPEIAAGAVALERQQILYHLKR